MCRQQITSFNISFENLHNIDKEVIEKQEKLPLNVLKRIEDWKGGDDELDLSNLGLVNIEFILPENVKRLNLSNNKLGLYGHLVGYDKNELEY